MSDVSVTRHRSPAYPAFGLKTAIEKTKLFYLAQKRNAVYVDVAAKTMGYEGKSSTGLRAIAALISFGLLEEEGSATSRKVKLTPLGYKIMFLSEEDPERETLVQEAALKPAIYREMVEMWGADLPTDEAIKKVLVLEKKFNPEAVAVLVRDFRSSVIFANLADRGILSAEETDKNENHEHAQAGNEGDDKGWSAFPNRQLKFPMFQEKVQGQSTREAKPMTSHVQPEMQTFVMPLLGGKVAILQSPVGLSEKELKMMDSVFQVIKDSISADQDTSTTNETKPQIRTGYAIWHGKDADQAIVVIGYFGEHNGRHFVSIEGSSAGVPLDEIEYDQP